MAPQLGIGTFRIDQSGAADAYAMSNGNNKEVWALRKNVFIQPTFPGATSTLAIHPIAPAPPVVDCAAMNAFLTGIPENPNDFEIRDHSITVCP